jgi:pilus assembly protein Flp/PilA
MMAIILKFRTLLSNNRAATAIEYGLIIGLVSIAILVAVTALGDAVSSIWGSVASDVDAAMP